MGCTLRAAPMAARVMQPSLKLFELPCAMRRLTEGNGTRDAAATTRTSSPPPPTISGGSRQRAPPAARKASPMSTQQVADLVNEMHRGFLDFKAHQNTRINDLQAAVDGLAVGNAALRLNGGS